MKLKRYIAFAGDQFYPGGGASDMIGNFDDFQSAVIACQEFRCDNFKEKGWQYRWANILDLHTGQIVFNQEPAELE